MLCWNEETMISSRFARVFTATALFHKELSLNSFYWVLSGTKKKAFCLRSFEFKNKNWQKKSKCHLHSSTPIDSSRSASRFRHASCSDRAVLVWGSLFRSCCSLLWYRLREKHKMLGFTLGCSVQFSSTQLRFERSAMSKTNREWSQSKHTILIQSRRSAVVVKIGDIRTKPRKNKHCVLWKFHMHLLLNSG